MARQSEAFKKQVAKHTKGSDKFEPSSTENRLAITETGKIKKDVLPEIKGEKYQEKPAKKVLEIESNIVKDINYVENKKNPNHVDIKREIKDLNNLRIIHPELADKVELE